jgi:hypothetical protein
MIFGNFFLILPPDTPLIILMAFRRMNEYACTTMDETAWRQRADAGDLDSRWKFGRIEGEQHESHPKRAGSPATKEH